MTDQPSSSGPRGAQPIEVEIDTTVAHPARVLNYLAGGAGNFGPADDVPPPPSGRPVPIYGAVGRKP